MFGERVIATVHHNRRFIMIDSDVDRMTGRHLNTCRRSAAAGETVNKTIVKNTKLIHINYLKSSDVCCFDIDVLDQRQSRENERQHPKERCRIKFKTKIRCKTYAITQNTQR